MVMKWFVGLALMVAIGASACATAPGVANGCGRAIEGAVPACSHISTAPSGGLSKDAAIAAAHTVAPKASSDPTVIWAAAVERSPFAAPNASEDSWVWEVRLQGAFAASPCPSGFLDAFPTPSDPACLDQDSGLVAVLDYYSGAMLGWTH
jgi:hypothetical protein